MRVPLALIFVVVVASSAAAYERPLRPHSIREAYFLGQRKDATTAAFLAKYKRQLPIPKNGPHVAEIAIHTPYEQVVLRAARAPDGYSSSQAERESRVQPDVILVSVRINATPSFSPSALLPSQDGFRPAEFWRDFSFRLIQGEKQYPPQKVTGRLIFSSHGSLVGADVHVEFDASKVDSAPATVQVLTPDGQDVRVRFELDELR